MFAELVELGRRVYKGHDAFGTEKCNWDIVIDSNGNFRQLIHCEVMIEAEKLSAKKGKARLLLDKPEETLLGYRDCQEDTSGDKDKTEEEKKFERYFNKLKEYRFIKELEPVFSFYSKPEEVGKAIEAFRNVESKKEGNMTYVIEGSGVRLVEMQCVHDAIKEKYEQKLRAKRGYNGLCAICGTDEYPILKEPHGGIRIPKGNTAGGSMLVSYNKNAFESYGLKGNLNSGICTKCARNYVEALKFLTQNGHEIFDSNGKKEFKYTNRQKISDDTIALFWTKVPDDDIDPWSDICQPTVERIRKMFSSVASGSCQRVDTDVVNYFYCCTLSSAAARIAVRDWMAMSVAKYQSNLKQWFEDIATIKDGEVYYPGINTILNNCIKKKTNKNQSDYNAKSRIGTMLWYAALTNSSLPLMVLQSVLSQIEHENDKYCGFSVEKSTVIRLILNRNNKNKCKMKNELDEQNLSKAYLCGRLFALICKLQYSAQGEVNSSIKNRFFASVSVSPTRVMGLLLTKYVPVYQKKSRRMGKYTYATDIADVVAKIGHFPNKFSLIERGEFALGYYYQYNNQKKSDKKEQE